MDWGSVLWIDACDRSCDDVDWFVTERERDETEIDQEGETGYGENMRDLREIRK